MYPHCSPDGWYIFFLSNRVDGGFYDVVGVGGGGGVVVFFFQAEDGIRDLVRSRGLGDVYKRQAQNPSGSSMLFW